VEAIAPAMIAAGHFGAGVAGFAHWPRGGRAWLCRPDGSASG